MDLDVLAGVRLDDVFNERLDVGATGTLSDVGIMEDRLQLPIGIRSQPHPLAHRAADRLHGEVLLAGEDELDRAAVELGGHRGYQEVVVRVLAAERAARQGSDDAHLVVEMEAAEHLGDQARQPIFQPEAKRLTQRHRVAVAKLAGQMNGEATVVVPGGDDTGRLHRVVVVR